MLTGNDVRRTRRRKSQHLLHNLPKTDMLFMQDIWPASGLRRGPYGKSIQRTKG